MALKDQKQNFWQLACLVGSAPGLPGMMVGGHLAYHYGVQAALSSILIGNFILWIVGLGMISMASDGDHAIENIKSYLGKFAGFFAAIIWVLAFILWYALQIKMVSMAISNQIPVFNGWILGAVLGSFVAILGIGGINLIKKACVFSLPLLVCYIFYSVISSGQIVRFDGSWMFSIPAIAIIVLGWLPGVVNFPTLFRHSLSRADSVLGLTLVTIIQIFFQSSAILMNVKDLSGFLANQAAVGVVFVVGFALLSNVLSNLVNIYFASAGWETIMPFHRTRIEYFFVGFLGMLVYVLFQAISPGQLMITMEFCESILTCFIATLCAALLIAFLIKLVVRHRPKPYEKLWSSISWLVGSVTALIVQVHATKFDTNIALVKGIAATALTSLIIVFIEETIWSIKHLPAGNVKSTE